MLGLIPFFNTNIFMVQGSCCGSVSKANTSDTRGPRFESSHRQIAYYLHTVNCIEKTNINEKEAGNGTLINCGTNQDWSKE